MADACVRDVSRALAGLDHKANPEDRPAAAARQLSIYPGKKSNRRSHSNAYF